MTKTYIITKTHINISIFSGVFLRLELDQSDFKFFCSGFCSFSTVQNQRGRSLLLKAATPFLER
jgi:hypothetical protein